MFYDVLEMPRLVGPWAKDKLKILEAYLPAYLEATTTAIDRIYVDAFAGPGKNIVRKSREQIDGSPLIALKARGRNGQRFTRLFFIEKQPELAEELRRHIAALGEERRCQVIVGDANDELPKAFRGIHRRAPSFVFLDTQTINPRWSTIRSIAFWQVEFLINFPLGMSINRNPDSAKTAEYFGTDDCLPILHGKRIGTARALLDLYKSRLAELGFAHTTTDDRLVRTQNNKQLYYLVFVSKHPLGETIMNVVFNQPDSLGQGRMRL